MTSELISNKILFWLLGALLTSLLAVGGYTMRGMAQTQADHRISISRNAITAAENRRDVYNLHEDLMRIEKKIDALIAQKLLETTRRGTQIY